MSNKLLEIAEDSARGGLFLFTGNTLSLATLAIGSIIVARLLGPDGYGLYSLSLVVPLLFTGFIDLGISYALTRFSAKLRSENKLNLMKSMLKIGFLFELALSIAVFVVCFSLSDLFATYILNRPDMGVLVKVSSFLIPFYTVFTVLSSSFIGLDKMESSALIMNIQSFLKTIASPLLILLGFGVIGVIAGHILGYLLAALAGSLFLLKYYLKLDKPVHNSPVQNLKTMLNYGFPLYLSSLLFIFMGNYKTIVLAFFSSNFEIGNFSIATNLSSMVNVLVLPIMALFPAFSKVNPDSDEIRTIFRLSVKYSSLLIIPVAILISVLSREIVYTLYGYDYNLAPVYLSLYILSFLYAGLGSVILFHLFSGIGETKAVFNWNLINLVVFVPLAPLLTMFFNISGLILAFLIAALLSLAYAVNFIKKLKISLDFKTSLRIYFASSISIIPVIAFLQVSFLGSILNLILCAGIFFFTYITLVPLLKAIKESDLENFGRIFKKIKIIWPIMRIAIQYEYRLLNLRTKSSR